MIRLSNRSAANVNRVSHYNEVDAELDRQSMPGQSHRTAPARVVGHYRPLRRMLDRPDMLIAVMSNLGKRLGTARDMTTLLALGRWGLLKGSSIKLRGHVFDQDINMEVSHNDFAWLLEILDTRA